MPFNTIDKSLLNFIWFSTLSDRHLNFLIVTPEKWFLTMVLSSLSRDLVPLHNACSYGHYEVTELLVKVSYIKTCNFYRQISLLCFIPMQIIWKTETCSQHLFIHSFDWYPVICSRGQTSGPSLISTHFSHNNNLWGSLIWEWLVQSHPVNFHVRD